MRRRKARELALKILYQMDLNHEDPRVALDNYCKIFPYPEDVVAYARFLLTGIERQQKKLDDYIVGVSEHWAIHRITYVDRNILRMAIFEMLFSEDVPPKVAIDEAIELGKKFGSEDSKDFINGILDRILKDHYQKGDEKGNEG